MTYNIVVEGSDILTVTFADDTSVEANIKGPNSENDLAVIAVPMDSISDDTMNSIAIGTVGDSHSVKVGDPAIAIGNAHGDYPFPPKLVLLCVDEINAVTDVPLVLHGGSGIPEDQLAEAFSRGINKFNYGTDTMHCYNDAVLAYHKACEPAGSNDMIGEAEYVQKDITDILAKKLDLVKL